jgi:hypothetical protein
LRAQPGEGRLALRGRADRLGHLGDAGQPGQFLEPEVAAAGTRGIGEILVQVGEDRRALTGRQRKGRRGRQQARRRYPDPDFRTVHEGQ